MIVNNSQKIVTDGLVLNLDPAQLRSYIGSGTSCKDISANDLTGTLVNGVGFSTDGGGSFVYDGVNDNINFGNNLGLTDNFTFCLWIKPTNFSNYRGLIGKTNGSTPRPFDYYLDITSGKPLLFTGSPFFGISSPTIGVWNFVCVALSSPNCTHYLNGVSNGTTASMSITTNLTNNFLIGSRSDNATRMLGNIGIVNMYNRALTSAEILQNYNANKSRYI